MTRTVTDAALLMTPLTKPDPRDFMALPYQEIDWPGLLQGGVNGKKLGLLLDIGIGLTLQPAVRAAIEAAASRCAGSTSTGSAANRGIATSRLSFRIRHATTPPIQLLFCRRKAASAQTTFVPSRKAESQLPLGGTSTLQRCRSGDRWR